MPIKKKFIWYILNHFCEEYLPLKQNEISEYFKYKFMYMFAHFAEFYHMSK